MTKVDGNRVIGGNSGRARPKVLVVLIGVLALAAVVCASGSAAGAVSSAPTSPVVNNVGPNVVVVRMVDFRLEQPAMFAPGRYTFRAVNAGQAPHALQINGLGVANVRTPVVQPGRSADLTVTLVRGNYDFWCPIGNHRQQGMQLNVRVG